MNHKRFGISGRFLSLLLILGFVLLVFLNIRNISDYIKLYGYVPTTEVEQLATETTMTDHGRKLFYINRPLVAERAAFNQYCSSHGENSIVLGCYHGVDRGIYLFRITEPRLAGVEQVTAAHEMLHAAYDRLNSSDRKRIDGLLTSFYETQVTDQRVKDTIAAYETSEPNDVVNEMHSIFPTEIAELPDELELYYADFFSDRSKVVDFANNYQQEFSSRRDQVKAYDDQLAAIKAQMDFNTDLLDKLEADIATMQSRMTSDRNAGRIEEYNSQVTSFNSRVEQYNNVLTATQGLIKQYNNLVAERNNIALEVKSLAQSINSRIEPLE